MAIFKKVAYFAPRYINFIQSDATVPANAYIFVADDNYEVADIKVRYSHIGASDATVDLFKVASGTALGSGTTVLSGTVSLFQTADTTYTKSLTATLANRKLIAGDALAVDFAGTLTALTGLCVEVVLRPTSHITNTVR
jgi:hypothetical protein